MNRVLVAYCPYWALVVGGYPPSVPVAVLSANRVVVASPGAQAAGVRVGMRRREAEGACPTVEVAQRDIAGEARHWEIAVAAVEELSPGVEVLGPGELALSAKGPSRYFGGDRALALKVAGAVQGAVDRTSQGTAHRTAWAGCCRVGVADGLFAARLAAGLAPHAPAGAQEPGQPTVVPQGGTPPFLAPLPLRALLAAGPGAAFEDLVGLFRRLGVKTLGELAALPLAPVLSRFGSAGWQAHNLATGLSDRAVQGREPPLDWAESAELDPPADNLQAAVFVGRALADELHKRLSGSGLVCTRLAIEAETEHGATLRRSWRHEGALSSAAIGQRVRWQLEGWAQPDAAQAGRITKLSLVPEEVCPDRGRQLGFWGGDAGAEARAARAFARVQSLLGPCSVLTALLQGGRDHRDQVHLVPWGEPRVAVRPGPDLVPGQAPRLEAVRQAPRQAPRRAPRLEAASPPWPGRLPGLAPAVVYRRPLPAQVLGADGSEVSVGGRGTMSAPPAWVTVGKEGPVEVQEWAGPWPLEERWWDAGGRRRARAQVLTAGGNCYLLARETGRWWVEAAYD